MNNEFLNICESVFVSGVDDIFDTINILLEEVTPKKFYRKTRTRKGIKRRYMIKVNPVCSMLADNLIMSLKLLKCL